MIECIEENYPKHMKYYQSYEKVYQDLRKNNHFNPLPNISLVDFFKQEVKSRLPLNDQGLCDLLEIGCGAKSLFHDLNDSQLKVLGIDISKSAISWAQELNKNEDIKYLNQDVCEMNFKEEFDLVFDGHLLHCLTSDEDRKTSLENIYNSLRPNGLFVLETMTAHKNMSFEEKLHFENNILYRLFTNVGYDLKFIDGVPYLPIRKIKTAMDVEQEIIQAGFQIIYLYVFGNRKIIPYEGRSVPLLSDPDSLRLIAIKK
ncbi:MAG: class I SAM-dependent methyltransferase [Deltaproteobacteria bacterium]|nr:MAG: class I SAM-dependent methyltransferase [Deltaproteobacteria bacterium]